jgi:hypothetical protein
MITTFTIKYSDHKSLSDYLIFDTDYFYVRDWEWGRVYSYDSSGDLNKLTMVDVIFKIPLDPEFITLLKIKFNI